MAMFRGEQLPGDRKTVAGLSTPGAINMQGAVLQPSLADTRHDVPSSVGTWFADLLDAALSGNHDAMRKVGTHFAQEYRGADRREVHSRINNAFRTRVTQLSDVRSVNRLPVDAKSRVALIEEQPWPSTPLLLDERMDGSLRRFLAEAQRAEELSKAGLGSRSNMLLSGPPGTGKTLIAGHIAARLGLPFHTVRLDSVVSSLLGDTAKNIRALFEFAAAGPGFLFLDEVDAIAKRRDDQRELGEIKRVVNTLIQGLDLLPEKTVIVAATNHAHLLDPAIFRRFPYYLEVEAPNLELRGSLWGLYLQMDEVCAEPALLAAISDGLSCSDIRELAVAARRTALIERTDLDIAGLVWGILRSQAGKISLPPSAPLAKDFKDQLRQELRIRFELSYESVGRLTGVTKQAAMKSIQKRAKT